MSDPEFIFAAGWSNLYIPIPPTAPSHLSSCEPVTTSRPRTSSSRVSHGANDGRRVMMRSIESLGMVTFGNRQTILPASPNLLPSHTEQLPATHLSPAQTRSEEISDVSGHSYPLLSDSTLDRKNQEPLIDRSRLPNLGYGRGQSRSSTPGLLTSVSESNRQTAGILHPKDLIDPKTFLIPLIPTIHRPKPFDSSTIHPASLGTAIRPISPRDSGDVRTIHPACAAFRSISVAGLESSGTFDSFDSSSIHPASVGSLFGVSPFKVDEEDQGDVRYFHPASIAFSTATSTIRHSSTGCAVTKEDSVNIDVRIVHPASINMSLPAPLSHLVHPNGPSSLNVQPVSPNVHPASISHNTQNSLGPSESRYVHPASSSFKTFDASTIHPASVYSRPAPHQPTYHHSTAASSKAFGQSTAVLDHGDVRLSHPGWIGFGLAKPQRPKL